MEIYIFDETLQRLATIDSTTKITWEESYYEADIVSIELAFNLITDVNSLEYEKNKELFEALTTMIDGNKYMPRIVATDYFGKENIRVANIESFEIDEQDKSIKINARGFLSILEYKECYDSEFIPQADTDDHVGMVACRLINEHISLDPVLSQIFEAIESDNKIGTEVYFVTEKGDNVYDNIIKLLTAYNLGFNTFLDLERNKIAFKVIEPNDEIVLAVSKDDGNLDNNVYEVDITAVRNYICIDGTYEEEVLDEVNEKLIVEVIDNSDGSVIMNTNISSSKSQFDLSEDEYRELIRTEAKIELENHTVEEDFEIDIADDIDVNLGDVVVCKLWVGYKEIAKESKVSVIKHCWENGLHTRSIDFGKPYNAKTELKNILGSK